MADSQSPLLHGGAGKGREADHVADGINVRHIRLVIGVDLQAFTVIRFQAGAIDLHG